MKKIVGIIGGVSWESTVLYYKLINQAIRERSGGLNSAKLLIYSLNYEPITALERQDNWQAVAAILIDAAQHLEKGGVGYLMLACNTLHKVAPQIESAIKIPFLHIADVVGESLVNANIQKVALLGTQITMEDGFYAERLKDKFNIEVMVPEIADRQALDKIIYDELCMGKFLEVSRSRMAAMMATLVAAGAQGIILGCTELGMLVQPEDVSMPLFDSTILHVNKAVELS